MVKVSSFNVRESKDGRTFITLELTGSVEFTQSQTTGKMYATVRKTNIPCTFDEATAAQLVGSQIPGEIVRVESDPYEFTTQTGEVMLLDYSYAYQASATSELIPDQVLQDA